MSRRQRKSAQEVGVGAGGICVKVHCSYSCSRALTEEGNRGAAQRGPARGQQVIHVDVASHVQPAAVPQGPHPTSRN